MTESGGAWQTLDWRASLPLTEAEQRLAQEHRRQASFKLKMAALLGKTVSKQGVPPGH